MPKVEFDNKVVAEISERMKQDPGGVAAKAKVMETCAEEIRLGNGKVIAHALGKAPVTCTTAEELYEVIYPVGETKAPI
jgi:hypothetical protein